MIDAAELRILQRQTPEGMKIGEARLQVFISGKWVDVPIVKEIVRMETYSPRAGKGMKITLESTEIIGD